MSGAETAEELAVSTEADALTAPTSLTPDARRARARDLAAHVDHTNPLARIEFFDSLGPLGFERGETTRCLSHEHGGPWPLAVSTIQADARISDWKTRSQTSAVLSAQGTAWDVAFRQLRDTEAELKTITDSVDRMKDPTTGALVVAPMDLKFIADSLGVCRTNMIRILDWFARATGLHQPTKTEIKIELSALGESITQERAARELDELWGMLTTAAPEDVSPAFLARVMAMHNRVAGGSR